MELVKYTLILTKVLMCPAPRPGSRLAGQLIKEWMKMRGVVLFRQMKHLQSILITLFLAGLGKIVFDPAVQAYVSERVPYNRRATAIGFLEISWAGSTLLGIPLIALLIDKVGWRSPFFAMGIIGFAGIIALIGLFPSDEQSILKPLRSLPVRKVWPTIVQDKASLGALAYVFFFSAAIDNLFVIYGAWLEKAFSVGIVMLGMATGVIGVAELVGEILVATISDRLWLVEGACLESLICWSKLGCYLDFARVRH